MTSPATHENSKNTPHHISTQKPFENNQVSEYFHIDRYNGSIWSLRSLDREEVPVHFLKVLAVDHGTPPLTGSVDVTIFIEDVNDNDPVFLFPSPIKNVLQISSVAPVGPPLGILSARDVDADHNAKISFTLLTCKRHAIETENGSSGNDVARDEKIYLKNAKNVKKQTKEITKTNNEKTNNYWAQNEDDHNEHLTSHHSKLTGLEETYKENNKSNRSCFLFSVDPLSGTIHARKNLLSYTEQKYRLYITAQDSGTPSRTTSAHLEIIINSSIPHQWPAGVDEKLYSKYLQDEVKFLQRLSRKPYFAVIVFFVIFLSSIFLCVIVFISAVFVRNKRLARQRRAIATPHLSSTNTLASTCFRPKSPQNKNYVDKIINVIHSSSSSELPLTSPNYTNALNASYSNETINSLPKYSNCVGDKVVANENQNTSKNNVEKIKNKDDKSDKTTSSNAGTLKKVAPESPNSTLMLHNTNIIPTKDDETKADDNTSPNIIAETSLLDCGTNDTTNYNMNYCRQEADDRLCNQVCFKHFLNFSFTIFDVFCLSFNQLETY